MTLCSNAFPAPAGETSGFDYAFYLFLLRLLGWLWSLLKRGKKWMILPPVGKNKTYPDLPPTYSRNEFGYVNMNGAY